MADLFRPCLNESVFEFIVNIPSCEPFLLLFDIVLKLECETSYYCFKLMDSFLSMLGCVGKDDPAFSNTSEFI